MLPARALARGATHHLRAELVDQAGVLGDGHELGGRHGPPVDVLPARERLGAHYLATVQRHQGLIVQVDLLVGERCAQS
jgi:hypothetical protein